jgi:DNA processing protein
MTELEALVGLNLVMDIGSIRLKRLLEIFGAPQKILAAPVDKLIQAAGIGEAIASRIASLNQKEISREFALAEKFGFRILAAQSPEYPQNLKFIDDPPIILYVWGGLLPEDNLGLAIVGSRRASFYGLSSAEKFAGDLAARGFTVVSGMARGIDTQAHRGALKSGGRTIAVIGSGLADIYPQENLALARQIAARGAVISEFPVNSAPLRQNFPRRNRVISGLSLGVLVVEACRNSGALITADFALEQGRDVFALPGKIDSAASFGTNELIKQGAKLVVSVEDILDEIYFWGSSEPSFSKDKKPDAPPNPQGLSCKEELLYNIISSQRVSVEEIVHKTGSPVSEISLSLLSLQLKKKIRALAGRIFERI